MGARRHVIGHIRIADVPGRNERGTGEINYPPALNRIDWMGYGGRWAWRAEGSFGWLEE